MGRYVTNYNQSIYPIKLILNKLINLESWSTSIKILIFIYITEVIF